MNNSRPSKFLLAIGLAVLSLPSLGTVESATDLLTGQLTAVRTMTPIVQTWTDKQDLGKIAALFKEKEKEITDSAVAIERKVVEAYNIKREFSYTVSSVAGGAKQEAGQSGYSVSRFDGFCFQRSDALDAVYVWSAKSSNSEDWRRIPATVEPMPSTMPFLGLFHASALKRREFRSVSHLLDQAWIDAALHSEKLSVEKKGELEWVVWVKISDSSRLATIVRRTKDYDFPVIVRVATEGAKGSLNPRECPTNLDFSYRAMEFDGKKTPMLSSYTSSSMGIPTRTLTLAKTKLGKDVLDSDLKVDVGVVKKLVNMELRKN